MEFLAAFIQGQNGFGCYNMIASYPQGDEVTREAILTSAASFQCLGPAETSYQLLSDEKLSFQFMYAEEEAAPSFEIGDNVLTATSMAGSEYSILTISAIPSSGKKTADQVLAQVTDGLDAIYPGITQHGEQQTQESGGMEWVVRNYASESQGITVYMSYSAAVWQDQAYLILLTSSQEAQLEGSGLKRDIMGSLRPAA